MGKNGRMGRLGCKLGFIAAALLPVPVFNILAVILIIVLFGWMLADLIAGR